MHPRTAFPKTPRSLLAVALVLSSVAALMVAPPAVASPAVASPAVASPAVAGLLTVPPHADPPTFHWVATWGAAATPGELSAPADIAVDAAGNVYIADTGNHRVQVFTPGGTFLRGFGQVGRGDGEFYNPQGITVHGDRVYVADTDNSRVQAFTLGGVFVRQIGVWGDLFYTPGTLMTPSGIDTDATGRVYILNQGFGGNVKRFAVDGAEDPLTNHAGGTSSALAVLSSGVFFCPASHGLIYVPLSGEHSPPINSDPSQPGYLRDTQALTTAPDDSLWSYDLGSGQIKHFDSQGSYLGGFLVDKKVIGLAASSNRIYALTAAPEVLIYDWNGNRLNAWGVRAFAAPGSFDRPDRLAAAPDGTFYVLERSRRRIQHLDGNGRVLDMIGTGLAAQGNLVNPQDITVDSLGRLYVLDEAYRGRVVRFADDRFDAWLPTYPIYASTEIPPVAIAATGDTLQVVNNLGYGLRTDLDGVRIGEWPTRYYEGSYLDLAVTGAGRAYVLSQRHWQAIRMQTLAGEPISYWGVNDYGGAVEPGRFILPTGIAADLRGRIFVVDTDNREIPVLTPIYSSRVQVFDESGGYLAGWGSFGRNNGQFANAQAVAALPNGRIVVADTGNNRLQVFAPDGPLPPYTPLPGPTRYDSPLPPQPATWEDYDPVGGSAPSLLALPPAVTPDQPIIAAYAANLAASADGVHWRRLTDPMPGSNDSRSVSLLLYAGSHTLLAQRGQNNALYRSTNLGHTWTRLGDAIVAGEWLFIAPSPTFDSDGILFAASRGSGFWRSTDRGDTWELRGLPGGRPFFPIVATAADGTRTILVGNTGNPGLKGILRSTDDGLTWQVTSPSGDPLAVSPDFARDHTAFAVRAAGSDIGLSRSTDGGISWNRIATDTLPTNIYWGNMSLSPNYATDHTLAIWAYRGPAYLSTDAGETWALLAAQGQAFLWFIAFAPTYAQDGRIWRSSFGFGDQFQVTTDRGASWQTALDGLPGAAIYGVAELPDAGGTPWLLIREGVLVRDGEHWTWLHRFEDAGRLGRPVALTVSPAFTHDGTAIAYREVTTDGGATWQGLAPRSSVSHSAAAFAPDYASSRTIAFAWADITSAITSIRVSTDGGITWQDATMPTIFQRALTFDAAWPAARQFYVGGEGGIVYSADLGQNWQRAGEPVAWLNVTGLVSRSEGNQSILYAATSTRGVWRSTNGGQTWAELNRGLPNGHVCALAQGADDLLAVGLCDGSLYLWQSALASWQRLGDPAPGGIYALLLQGEQASGTAWVGTTSGLYRTTFPAAALTPRLWFPLLLRQ